MYEILFFGTLCKLQLITKQFVIVLKLFSQGQNVNLLNFTGMGISHPYAGPISEINAIALLYSGCNAISIRRVLSSCTESRNIYTTWQSSKKVNY